jgi:hypothetical protein
MRNRVPTAKGQGSAGIAEETQNVGGAAEREKSIRGISMKNSSLRSNRKVLHNEKTSLPYHSGRMGEREGH